MTNKPSDQTDTTLDPDAPSTPSAVVQEKSARGAVTVLINRASRIFAATSLGTFMLLVLIVILFALLAGDRFFTTFNLRNIAIDTSGLLLISVGMTFVIIVAGIDLSVGAVLVFSAVIGAKAMIAAEGSPLQLWIGLAATVLAGLAWGIVNGILIAKASLPPLIVTLGTLSIALGLSYVISGGFDVRGVPPELNATLGTGSVLGIPNLVLVSAIVAAVAWVLLTQTRFGRHTFAIGSNLEAARRAGIAVERHLITVYAMSGLLAGLAGYLNLARFQTTTIAGHSNDILQAITAVTLGGTSLFGGVGTIVGTVIGTFIPAVLRNGLVILGIQPFWQQVVVGAMLIGVVYLDHLRRRARQKR